MAEEIIDTTTILAKSYGSLGTKLENAQKYVQKRYDYYNDEQTKGGKSDAIKTTVDNVRNKLLVSHFINAINIEEYFTKNFMNKVINSCVVSGCAFARINKKSDGKIELIPYDAYFATGKLNNDNTLSEAISIDETDSKGTPTKITKYTSSSIIVSYPGQKKKDEVITNKSGVIPIVPVIIRQNALKPFGCSLITKKMIADTDLLSRTKKRAEKVQETLSEANTFLLGVSQDLESELDDKTLALLQNVIMITQSADSQTPNVVTRENGVSQLEQKIKDLETSIMYDTSNIEYMDMVESIRQDLIDSVNNIGNTIIKVLNDDKSARLSGKIDIVFKNNDFSNLSAMMDGILKTGQMLPGYFGKEQLDKILGINGNKPNLVEAVKDEIKEDVDGTKKMYATKSIVKDFESDRITESQAIDMLELVGYSEEDAKAALYGKLGD